MYACMNVRMIYLLKLHVCVCLSTLSIFISSYIHVTYIYLHIDSISYCSFHCSFCRLKK